MAKFIINSAGTRAVRKEDIELLEIDQMITGSDVQGNPTYGRYELKVVIYPNTPQITFEIGDTLEEVQALVAPIMAALEA